MTALPAIPNTQREPFRHGAPHAGHYLIAVHGGGLLVRRLPTDRPATVGRAPDCDVAIDDPRLAPVHFSLAPGLPALVVDRAGDTRVNGRPVSRESPALIDDSSVVDASGILFVLRKHAPPETARAIEEDDPMAAVYERIRLIARADLPVLIQGETGAGKEVVARTLHARSRRAGGPLVALNCANLPEALLESELFGYERGSFTGAVQAKAGLIEAADGGTLLLDEVGDMPLATQAKLLRALDSGELTRLGSVTRRRVDVRFVAATNLDVPALVAAGRFRADLYYRLNGITLQIPPLRARPREIPVLARHFLALAARRSGLPVPELSSAIVPVLAAHAWPGNVRELRNVMDRAVALSGGAPIRLDHIRLDRAPEGGARDASTVAEWVPPRAAGALRVDPQEERRRIVHALAQSGGSQTRAAQLLAMSRRSLLRRLDEYAVERPRKGSRSVSG